MALLVFSLFTLGEQSVNGIGSDSDVQINSSAQGRPVLAGQPQPLPPLIARELFFADPAISSPKLSPDGQLLAFLKPLHGVPNLWVKPLAAPMAKARPLTAGAERPIASFNWSRDGQFIVYSQDQGGDENFRLYRVDPDGPSGPNAVPPAQDLTPLEGVKAEVVARPPEQARNPAGGVE
jgi:dipeptidyl aminopeptidase/acylaminoacyl peptidase